ncbi:hypothetical protein [Roseateles sp. BYS87W]|uniref:SPOR domain-containing protein n=1 Tax=Pelomonas baiyunensis TaxID=3299026 RepID=A0ABW7H319_9BURK
MERLAQQIVDWHNRHPLARRITLDAVHTVGVVALPFVRASAQPGGLVEPVLTDAVSAFDELAGSPPVSRGAVWLQRLKGLAGRVPRLLGRAPRTQWRAFSEKFLPGLSPAQVERFALAFGFTEPPAAPESQPWRVIVIDEKLAARHSGWPFELYLMTAGIDVGKRRTRVIAGRGIPSQIAGRRLLDMRRVAAAAAVVLGLTGAAAALLWPKATPVPVEPAPVATAPAEAASAAASAALPAEAASGAASSADPGASTPVSEAAAHAGAASAADAPASAAPVAAASAPDPDAPPPDIRPRLVERADGVKRPPMLSSKPAEPAEAPDKRGGDAQRGAERPAGPDPSLARMAKTPDKAVVALVGPPGSKAEAEALLKKMQAGLAGVHANPESLQGDVIQTPDGWRATVWPFQTREQAQLINATLIARGYKTRAVNF